MRARLFHLVSRVLLVGSLAAPTAAHAQLSTTRGLSLGGALEGLSLETEGGSAHSGGGVALRAGYGFNRIVTGFIHVGGGEIAIPAQDQGAITGTWTLGHADIGARFHFANSLRRWVPYLEAAVGSRVVSVKKARVDGQQAGTVDFNGGSLTLGGGLSAYFTPHLALDASLDFTGGKFTEVDVGNVALQNLDIEAKSVRFGVGLTWWRGKR